MANVKLSGEASCFIAQVAANATEEKAMIADALTTATSMLQSNIENAEYLNLCTVLARYNRLISLISKD